MKSQAVAIVSFTIIFFVSAGARSLRQQRSVDLRNSFREYDMLKELLGRPKGNPVEAQAIKGTKKTTRLHKLCSGKKPGQKIDLVADWSEDTTAYDKVICGMYTMKDMYKKHSRNAAQILAGKHSDKTLDEQKKYLIEAINNMAKAAGPLPSLRIAGR